MQQADPPPGDTQNYLDKSQQHEQPQQHELLTQTPMGEDIYKDGDGADLDLAQDEGREDFTGSLDNDKSNKTARALELQEKNRLSLVPASPLLPQGAGISDDPVYSRKITLTQLSLLRTPRAEKAFWSCAGRPSDDSAPVKRCVALARTYGLRSVPAAALC